jgi:hypothetical protein
MDGVSSSTEGVSNEEAAMRTAKTEEGTSQSRFQIRLPGFLTDLELGVGDAVQRVGYSLGVKPCKGCEQRAAALNRWVAFTSGRRK